ncbi:MAG: ferrous iron transport protein B [Solobacterium sp.]|jgi:ferrous iron transport protein B|nr:ferrous iron transport protein B [Solobacterium sp.]MCH4048289.1 ferrous iron transport protein B [Solobacterium sp.]MCH4074858.1 ferrous iron transport protein B [Solobacterium sp.]MCI1314245.1 ferrous iron transport protein B [Solobacterium sp.]MCI1346320.1 ferrous iron transport protein B [Solobacterium sp.]
MNLKELKPGQSARVITVGGEGELRQHFLDMGLIPGAEVTLIKYAPMGDPMELSISGYELTLRLEEAEKITIKQIAHLSEKKKTENADDVYIINHAGFGEGGKYHDKRHEHPLPEGTVLTFALAGNQNCGKTTLFNQLTGSSQHVGNFPGVTVDQKSGVIKGHPDTLVTDLPGIYSLSPYTSEEIVSRRFILDTKPKGIINIVDATNIERNLYLTLQLMELDIPMVVALNMMDELRGNGGSVDINRIESMLGLPVVPISAVKNEGIDELVQHAVHVARYQEPPMQQDYCDVNEDNGAVHRALHGIMHLIEDHCKKAGISPRFAATKIAEGDASIMNGLDLSENEKEMIGHIIEQMEQERGLDHAAAIADMRFDFIHKVVDACVTKPHASKERTRSEKIDKVLTGKYTAVPCFIAIMAAVFYLTFNVLGSFLEDLISNGIDHLSAVCDAAMTRWGTAAGLHSMIIDGVFNGVGTVLGFIPYIVILFFFLSLLEDTGYMARIAFVMDKPLRKLGLSGRSIVPMLVGFGCSVPAVMSTRTLPSERDRKVTVMLIPFMSCTAKLPIYAFLTKTFFPDHAAFVMVLLYIIGILVGILVAMIIKKLTFHGEAVPFVMELPNYRMPAAKNVLQLLWEKTKDFLHRAFTIVFLACIIVWFLQTYSPHLAMVSDSRNSILAIISGWIAPIFKPLGFGDWRFSTALIAGFIAKEAVVSTLNVLFGSAAVLHASLDLAGAAAILVFCLLYTPCVAAIAAIRQELGGKQALQTVLMQCAIAWICAFVVHTLFALF